jgi:hypothetical protein
LRSVNFLKFREHIKKLKNEVFMQVDVDNQIRNQRVNERGPRILIMTAQSALEKTLTVASMIPVVNRYSSKVRCGYGVGQIGAGCFNNNDELVKDGIGSIFLGCLEAFWPCGVFYHGGAFLASKIQINEYQSEVQRNQHQE